MSLKANRVIRKKTAETILAIEGDICPLCKWRAATELHEIIPRSRLSGSPEALAAVFGSPVLCALVCRKCHPKGNGPDNWQLMAWKQFRYGNKAVAAAIAQVNEHLVNKIKLSDYGVET